MLDDSRIRSTHGPRQHGFRQVNESALRLLGGEREWIVGRPLIAYVDPRDMRKVLDSVAGGSGPPAQPSAPRSVEARLRGWDGIRTVQLITRRSTVPESPATLHIAIVDLSETRRLEEDRARAEQERQKSQEAERVARATSEAKDEFLAMLSHELRTPLTPILAATDSLVAHGLLSADLRAKLEIIHRNVRAEARLIDDLLDVARITRNKLVVVRKPTDLHRVITETLDGWTAPLAERRIALEVRLEAAGHWVSGDAGRLSQVVRNVLGNAAKFTDPEGRISVATSERNGRVQVSVADTGVGMTEEQQQRLFQPFVPGPHTSSRHGLGLGLVISRAIVDAHGGTLSVWSAGPGAGTTVRVELATIPAPAVEELQQPVAAGPTAVEDPGRGRSVRVLLVKDDRDTADMLAILLSSEGFEVQIAASVREARERAGACDVLVSDIALPDGSGLDLMRAIRQIRPLRGVALTGYGSTTDVQKSLEAGFEEHLTKPADLDTLVAAVRRLAAAR